jgi:hypothetical protein
MAASHCEGSAGYCWSPMPDLINMIREEIDARLEELRPLAREASDLCARSTQ